MEKNEQHEEEKKRREEEEGEQQQQYREVGWFGLVWFYGTSTSLGH